MKDVYMIFDNKDNIVDILLMTKEECKDYKIKYPDYVVEAGSELDNLEESLNIMNEDDE